MIRTSTDSGFRARTLLVVLAALVAFSGVGNPSPVAAAPPGLTFVQSAYIIDTSGGVAFRLCPGDQKQIVVTVHHFDYYVDGSGAQVVVNHGRVRGHALSAMVANPAIGTTSAIGATGGSSGGAPFTFEAKSPGRTTIGFTDLEGTGAAPLTVSMDVEDCYYSVHVTSRWRVRDGAFNPVLSSTISQAEMHPLAPGAQHREFRGHPTVENVGIGTPAAGCIPSISVPDTAATLSGEIPIGGGPLHIVITYDPVSATTTAACPAGTAISIGEGQAHPLDFRVPVTGGTRRIRHVVDATRTVTGTADIVVLRVTR